MRRRDFITLLGAAAATWPHAVRAQQSKMPVLGFLGSASEARYQASRTNVTRGLNEAGFVEKQNLLIEYRWADFRYDRLPPLAAEPVPPPAHVPHTPPTLPPPPPPQTATPTTPT